jgi:hypothetical protein
MSSALGCILLKAARHWHGPMSITACVGDNARRVGAVSTSSALMMAWRLSTVWATRRGVVAGKSTDGGRGTRQVRWEAEELT